MSDVLKIVECDNPRGWWTVRRNDKPLHHWSHIEDAKRMVELMSNGHPYEEVKNIIQSSWGQ